MVNQLSSNIDVLKQKVTDREYEQATKMTTLQVTDESLRVQVKLLNNQNLAMKQDNKLLFEKLSITEKGLQDKDCELQYVKRELNE